MKITFIIVLVFASFLVSAQEDSSRQAKKEISNRFYVSVEGGPSFPLADFGNRNLENDKSGLALTGLGAKLRAGYAIIPNFLIVADAVWFYNPLDAKTLLNSLTSNQNNPLEFKYKVTTNAWKVYGGMAGVATRLDLDDTYCELKGMLGVMKGTFGSAQYSATDGVETQYIDETADDDLSIALNIGITFHLKISDRVAAAISGDYFVTEFDFDNVTATYSDGRPSENVGTYTQPVSAFHISAGLVFRF